VAYATLLPDVGESGALEDAQVLGDRGERHVKSRREFANGLRAFGEAREDGAAGGIGEGAEGGVERAAVIVNHMV
jgi:hypothetical protein